MTSTEKLAPTGERADLLETLGKHRDFLRYTVRDLTDERWLDFALEGPEAMSGGDDAEWSEDDWGKGFSMQPDETLAGLLERYTEVARRTDDLVATLPDLDVSHPLPEAPWFEPSARWSVRRVVLHVIAETAQHAGHADIIRESLDGSKTMG